MSENKPPTSLTSIDNEEERHRLKLKALADVDEKNVIDHQAVQAWADSLTTDKPLSTPQ